MTTEINIAENKSMYGGGGKIVVGSHIDPLYIIQLIFTGMWFLTVLFILSVIGAIIEKARIPNKILLWLVTYIIIYLLPCGVFMSNELKFLTPFFVMGIYSKCFNWETMPILFGVMSIFYFSICFYFYEFDDSFYKMYGDVLTVEFAVSTLFRTLCGLFGSLSFVFLCRYIREVKIIRNWFLRIGVLTLPIYVLHQELLWPTMLFKLNTYEMVYLSLSFVVSIFVVELSIYIYRLVTKPALKLVMFGDSPSKRTSFQSLQK